MTKAIFELAQHRMTRAKETFQEGVTLFNSKSPTGAMNRFYYSAFYAARALLSS